MTTPKRRWLFAAIVIVALSVGGGALIANQDGLVPQAGKRDRIGAELNTEKVPSGTSAPATAAGERSDTDNYRASVIRCNNAIAQQLDRLTRQLVNPQYGAQDWVDETKVILVEMAATADDAREIRPTKDYEESHSVWLEGVESYDWVAQNMGRAIVGPDVALMNQCNDALTVALTRFNDAQQLMEQQAAQ